MKRFPFLTGLILSFAPTLLFGAALTGTGVERWGDAADNRINKPQSAYPRQNADYPRKLSFTRIDLSGKPLPDDADSWSCVRDNVTGLVWEVKTTDSGLHGKWHTYTWFNPDEKQNGGVEGREGEPDDITCGTPAVVEAGCDTSKYVAAVNAAGWCGYKDWRLPTVDELASLVDYGSFLPAIPRKYFPDMVMPAGFWTSTPSAAGPSYAWIVIFDDGYLGTCVKSWNYYLRLVRDSNLRLRGAAE